MPKLGAKGAELWDDCSERGGRRGIERHPLVNWWFRAKVAERKFRCYRWPMHTAPLSPGLARMGVAFPVALLSVALLHVSSASAITIVKDETRAKNTYFEAASCRAPATVSLGVLADASLVEPASLHLGATVTAYDTYWEAGSSATITAVEVQQQSGRPVVVWTATPHPEMCDGDPLTDWGWYSVDQRFAVSYRVRHRVRLSRRDAADLAEEALARRFPFYGYSSGSSTRCRRTATRARCQVTFWGGDTSFTGVVKSRLSTSPDRRRLLWSYRLRVRQVNEYCIHVTHNYPCTTTHRKSRHRVRAPGWLL